MIITILYLANVFSSNLFSPALLLIFITADVIFTEVLSGFIQQKFSNTDASEE